jgi:hypothetical protein
MFACIGVVPILDIFVTFFRAFFLPNGTLVYNLMEIRIYYISRRLLTDLVAFFPLDVIMSVYAAASHPYFGFIRLPRMLAVYTVWYKRGYSFNLGAEASMTSAILRLLAITAAITHLFACVWFFIGTSHMLDVRYNLSSCVMLAVSTDGPQTLRAVPGGAHVKLIVESAGGWKQACWFCTS